MLALLAATRDPAGVYPGKRARVVDVIALCRPDNVQTANHLRGAISTLAHTGYAVIDATTDMVRTAIGGLDPTLGRRGPSRPA